MAENASEMSTLTFATLKELTIDEVKLNVAKEKAVYVSLQSYKESGTEAAEILSIWLNKILRAYTTTTATVEHWEYLLNFLREALALITCDIDALQDSTISDYGQYLCDVLEYTRWAEDFLVNADETVICVIASYLLNTVFEFTDWQAKYDNHGGLDAHIDCVTALHNLILSVINESVERFEPCANADAPADEQQLIFLTPQMCEVAERMQLLDLRSTLENWKTLANLCIHYRECWANGTRVNCLLQPLEMLLNDVAKNVSTVYRQDTLAEPLDKIVKFLRVTSFNLQLLYRIFDANVQHIEAPSITEILFNLHVSLHCKPLHVLNTDVALLLDQYVLDELLRLLQLVLQKASMWQLLLPYVAQHGSELPCFNVSLDYLHAGIAVDESLTLDTCKMYTELFSLHFKGVWHFIVPAHYDDLVELFATLTHCDETCNLINYFRCGLHSRNLMLQHACADVLIVVERTLPASFEDTTMLAELNYWQRNYELFVYFSSNASKGQIQRMLKNSQQLCDERSLNRKVNDLNTHNYKLWQCVDCASMAGQLTEKLAQLLEHCDSTEPTKSAYYEMLICMQLLAQTGTAACNNRQLLEPTLGLCQCILHKEHNNLSSYRLLFDMFFNWLMDANVQTKLYVLEKFVLHKNGCYLSQLVSWSMLKFLKSCAQLEHSLGACALDLVQANESHVHAAVLSQLLNCNQLSCDAIDICLYKALCVVRASASHNCTLQQPVVKKQRFMQSHCTSKDLVKSFFEQTTAIVKCVPTLDAADMRILRIAMNNLTNAIESKRS